MAHAADEGPALLIGHVGKEVATATPANDNGCIDETVPTATHAVTEEKDEAVPSSENHTDTDGLVADEDEIAVVDSMRAGDASPTREASRISSDESWLEVVTVADSPTALPPVDPVNSPVMDPEQDADHGFPSAGGDEGHPAPTAPSAVVVVAQAETGAVPPPPSYDDLTHAEK
jgi:hypothetical protein